MSRIAQCVIDAVLERASYMCEVQQSAIPSMAHELALPMQFHHRQARAMGGSKGRDQDTVGNLLYVCALHHVYIHAHPKWARAEGYIVSQYAETPS